MKSMEISALLQTSDGITRQYEQLSGRWDISSQIAHVHSEISEIYQALKHEDGREHILEELADGFLSLFTLANMLEVNGEELVEAIDKKLSVILERVRALRRGKK